MPVSFSVSATDPDNDELAYSWDFGDGIIEQSLTTIDHSFPVGGSYDVSVTISDRKGGTTVLQSSISISDPINNLNTRSSGTSQQLLALAANDSLIVASGDNGIFLYSNDGTTWNSFTVSGSIINLSINDIIWTGTEFIAVGANHNGNWVGVVFSSSDGKTWIKDFQTTAAIGDFGFLSVAANADASAIIAVGSDAKLYKRTAINNWSVVDWTLPENSNVNRFAAIAFGDGYFVAGGYNFAPPQTLILQRSSNGETWTNLVPDSGIQEQGHGLDTIEYLNGTFLGSGFTSRVRYSTDSGETWQTNQLGEVHRMSSFAYGNGIYSAHGTNFNDTPLDLLSTDGRNWKIVTAPTQALNDRIFFNNTFISVGDAGLILQTDSFLPPDQRGFTAWIIGFIQSGNGQGANANPDQDWAPNFLEYALGSNPSDPTSAPTPPSLTRDEQGRITISIHRFEKTDVLLTLEKSTDLTAWTPLAATADTDTESLLELVSDDSFNSSLPLFIRIKASQQ